MKLRNKKTGEIVDLSEGFIKDTYCGEQIMIKPIAISNEEGYVYKSLAELNAEWEDYEEPKEYWYINPIGKVYVSNDILEGTKESKEIGNYFKTKEEAEKAVEKLKAWKRLKDKGFRFGISGECDNTITYGITLTFSDYYDNDETRADLDLLFGGEE